MPKFSPKKVILSALFGRWKRTSAFEEGYTVLLPSPMDMPFLLRYALEGLSQVDTTHCKEILVVPDGHVGDRGDALQAVIDGFDDRRVSLVRPGRLDYFLFRNMKPIGGSTTHWLTIVKGITYARCAYSFLHDADAFFLDRDGLERQYAECRDGGFDVLGVTARWDPFYEEEGVTIPGTWEMMFSNRWARSRPPIVTKNGWWPTRRGDYEFDTLHHPMYLDLASGKIRVMDPPPKFVHFNGTIVSFRFHRAGRGKIDEHFRVLLLTMLGELIPPSGGGRWTLPTLDSLARGLTDPDAPVSYQSKMAVYQFPIFRSMLDELCESPVFHGERAERLRELVRPWDEHFRDQAPVLAEEVIHRRYHGMG